MTLRELMNEVETPDTHERVPSVLALTESTNPVVALEKMGKDIEITVFKNGFVLYQTGASLTVFPLTLCKDYTENDAVGEKHVIPYETFADQPWQVRTFMEGERRIAHNRKSLRAMAGELNIEWLNNKVSMKPENAVADPLLLIVDREDQIETRTKLYRILNTFTNNQKTILFQCVVNGRAQWDVAEELGTSRNYISDTLRKTLEKLRWAYHINEPINTRNLFYRADENRKQKSKVRSTDKRS